MTRIQQRQYNINLDDKIFKPGNVTYNSFNIAFDIPFSQQEDSLNEDLVQVEYENGYVIDIGWYPEMDPKGSLIIQLIHDHDWNKPVQKTKITEISELYTAVHEMKMKALCATIRKVQPGDENVLAHIQTESWKAAFNKILSPEILDKCTDINKATAMYKQLLAEDFGNGYILTANDKPHCIAYWDAARNKEYAEKAELICIHSLPDNWNKGYGSLMMDHVLCDIKNAGYSDAILWVFRDNTRARAFYESKGFSFTGISKSAFDTEEVLYSIDF